jgi:hypothetical protein
MEGEMRAHLVRSIEDTGEVDGEAFRAAFGASAESVFPGVLAPLAAGGVLRRARGRYRLADDSPASRRACAARFLEPRLARALGRLPA